LSAIDRPCPAIGHGGLAIELGLSAFVGPYPAISRGSPPVRGGLSPDQHRAVKGVYGDPCAYPRLELLAGLVRQVNAGSVSQVGDLVSLVGGSVSQVGDLVSLVGGSVSQIGSLVSLSGNRRPDPAFGFATTIPIDQHAPPWNRKEPTLESSTPDDSRPTGFRRGRSLSARRSLPLAALPSETRLAIPRATSGHAAR